MPASRATGCNPSLASAGPPWPPSVASCAERCTAMRLSPAGPAIRPPPRNLAAADDGPPRQAHVPAASLSCLAMLSSRATQAAGFADLEFPAWAAQDPGPGAAQDSARAALLIAQSIVDSERPWIAVEVEPSRVGENSFHVFATNRGRSPAAIMQSLEHIQVAIDESHLTGVPEYRSVKHDVPAMPVMLLPGKSVVIKTFGRDDLKGVCKSEETFRRVQNWEEKLFLCGKIIYRDLIAPPDNQLHETTWCCWYIHGRQKSGMVMAGPPSYNMHT